MQRELNFSNKFFSGAFVENEKDVSLEDFNIVINLADAPIEVDFVSHIAKHKSYLLKNTSLKSIEKAIILNFSFDPEKLNEDLNNFCLKAWDDNKVRYPNDPSKWHFKIRRSPIEKFDNLEINCWFLAGNEGSSIHNEHDFKEVHTQIYGLGVMNKFKEQNKDTLYQKMFMAPGFTHDYFFDENSKYPWHQYEAVTDSIWIAVCEY